MVKKILVALDLDSDTPIATRYATDIARRHGAEVTGLAVVDMGTIESEARGGGIGSMYYAEKLRENLTTEAREKAQQLIRTFESMMEDADVAFGEMVQEGAPFERILEDMKYFDLLVMGKAPHFFYSHPERRTETLARVVKESVAPTLVVGEEYEAVEKVLIAYDGSDASAKALRRFVHLKPYGTDVDVEVLHLYKDDPTDSELLLNLASGYLAAHGFTAHTVSRQSHDIAADLPNYARDSGADLLVAGAHSVSKIRRFAFGSTTAALLETCPIPMLLDS